MLKRVSYDHKYIDAIASWSSNYDELFIYAGVEFTFPLTADQLDIHFSNFPDREWHVIVENDQALAFGEIIPQEGNIPRLGRLIVDPAKRGKGYGAALIKALQERCVELYNSPAIQLFVFDFNETAIKSYLSYGFEFVKDGTIMVSHLGQEYTCHKMEYRIVR